MLPGSFGVSSGHTTYHSPPFNGDRSPTLTFTFGVPEHHSTASLPVDVVANEGGKVNKIFLDFAYSYHFKSRDEIQVWSRDESNSSP